jgi:hypothetical protein
MESKPEVKKFWIRTPKKVLPSGLTTGNQKVTLVAWLQDERGIVYSRATCNPEPHFKTGKRDRFSGAKAQDVAEHKLLHRPAGAVVVFLDRWPGETVEHLILRDIVERSFTANRSETAYSRSAVDALAGEKTLEARLAS